MTLVSPVPTSVAVRGLQTTTAHRDDKIKKEAVQELADVAGIPAEVAQRPENLAKLELAVAAVRKLGTHITITGPAIGGPAISVHVSNRPATRLRQVESFWRRNPGWARTNGVGDTLRGAMGLFPKLKDVAPYLEPTEFGAGQALLDQMGWQIKTKRQPQNVWWMAMNARLVGDAMLAEAYLRAGRGAELKERGHIAWRQYLHKSDQIQRIMGHTPGTGYPGPGGINKPGAVPNSALDPDWHKVPAHKRWFVETYLKGAARRAYWVAHDESIGAGAAESKRLLNDVRRYWPQEADFGSAWARSVEVHKYLNPPGASHWGILLQRRLLPQGHPVDQVTLTKAQRDFDRLLEGFEDAFPRGKQATADDQPKRARQRRTG